MISFIVNAIFAIIGMFLLTVVLSLMAWVILRLFRLLFPQRFGALGKRSKVTAEAAPVPAMKITPEEFKRMIEMRDRNTKAAPGDADQSGS